MSGSGTTARVACEMGKQYIGIDISHEYCEIARKRVKLIADTPTLFILKESSLECTDETSLDLITSSYSITFTINLISSIGQPPLSVFTLAILSITSIPSITSPKTVCSLSKWGAPPSEV